MTYVKTAVYMALFGVCIGVIITLYNLNILFKTEAQRIQSTHSAIDTTIGALPHTLLEGMLLANNQLTAALDKADKDINRFGGLAAFSLSRVDSQLSLLNVSVRTASLGVYDAGEGVQDIAAHTTQIESQVSDDIPFWHSRFLAVTGESMRLLDATRLTMLQVKDATPPMLKAAQDTSDHIASIAGSADTYVKQFTKPRTIGGKIWDVTGAVIHGCSRFC